MLENETLQYPKQVVTNSDFDKITDGSLLIKRTIITGAFDFTSVNHEQIKILNYRTLTVATNTVL